MNKQMRLGPIANLCLFLTLGLILPNFLLAGTFYIEPDTVYITGGAGEIFTVQLMAADDVLDLKGYEVYLAYNKNLVDTVEISEGSLTLPQNTYFDSYLINDSTQLLIESVILGGGYSVDGPGVLADITLSTIDAEAGGILRLNFRDIQARDVDNALMDISGVPGVVFINTPPAPFSLIEPPHQENLYLDYTDNVDFYWESTNSFYPGDTVSYKMYICTNEYFSQSVTDVYDLGSDTTMSLPVSSLDTARYFWKVEATNGYGFSMFSEVRYFQLNSFSYPDGFDLIEPSDEADLVIPITDQIEFSWNSSGTSVPGDYIRYNLYYSIDPEFSPELTDSVTDMSVTSYIVQADELESSVYYWKVKAYNTLGYHTWSSEVDRFFDLTVAANPGIFNLLTPDNGSEYNLNKGTGINLSWSQSSSVIPNDTITYTIYFGLSQDIPYASIFDTSVTDQLSISLPDSTIDRCQIHYWKMKATNRLGYDTLSANINSIVTYYRGDANGNDVINLLDITYLIATLYQGGPEPYPLKAGDPNCDGLTNILDITYLIATLYQGGAPPCLD